MNHHKERSGINFRAAHYWIARTAGACPHCHGATPLVALMLPPGHEALSIDEEHASLGVDVASGSDTWERVPRHAFLFYVESLPDEVRRHLQVLAPKYSFAASAASRGAYWANHCARCDAFQEDQDLFCEPEGAFSPVNSAAASGIELLPVAEALEVSAAGYALDPQFVDLEA
jgi:hypothetical protein